jgi:hypothetical protein
LACSQLAFADAPNPKAYLRFAANRYYVAVFPDPPMAAGAARSDVVAAVYHKGQLVTDLVGGPDEFGASFTLEIPDLSGLSGDPSKLLLAVLRYPTTAGRGAFATPVSTEISPAIDSKNPSCAPALALELASDPDQDPPPPYVTNRFTALAAYVREHVPAAEVESRTEEGTEPRKLALGKRFVLPTVNTRCFELTPPPPTGAFDLRLTFPPDAPVELRPHLLKTDLNRAGHADAPLAVDTADVGKRSIEQNLDLGLQFGSSVANNADGTRSRTNRGTLDLRFAPLLNLLPTPPPGSNSLWFITPFYVDARVSTGPIDQDTLAQNRIVFGTEAELRHYSSPTTYPTYQRVIFRAKNASDRDFHQAEWTGNIELQPVFSLLNRPLRWQEKTQASQLDPDPDREPKHIAVTRGFGEQVLPVMGFEVGHTWRNHNPVAAGGESSTVRRFYFGGTVTLDLTSYLTLSAQDLLYVRGEDPADRLHNYLLAAASVPLPAFTNSMAQSVFFSYERGGQPPFSTPDTNALKLGYRVQWDGWFGKRR